MPTTAYEAPTEAPHTRNRKGAAALALLLILCLAVGGALAYLTDAKQIVNQLILDTNLKIELTEPQWDAARDADPEYAKHLVPTETAVKDPTVTCTGTVPAYAVVKVKAPVFTGKVFDQDAGTIEDVADGDLFSIAWEDGWTLKETSEVADGFRTYTYLWPTVLNKDDSAKVFGSVTVANLIEGAGIDATQITVDAFGIQAEGFADADAAWAAYTRQEGDGGDNPDNPGTSSSTLSAARVNAAIPETATRVVFTADAPSDEQKESATDVTEEQNGGYLVYTTDNVSYVASADGGDVVFPEDASNMLSSLGDVVNVDLRAASTSQTKSFDNLLASNELEVLSTGENWEIASDATTEGFMDAEMADVADLASSYAVPKASQVLVAGTGNEVLAKVDSLDTRVIDQAQSIVFLQGTGTPLDRTEWPYSLSSYSDAAGNPITPTGQIRGRLNGSTFEIMPDYKGKVKAGLMLDGAFSNFTSARTLDLRNLDVSNTWSLGSMFPPSMQSLNVSGWNTVSVTNMMGMFSNCTSLTSIDMSSWDVRNVTNLNEMFNGCTALRTANLDNLVKASRTVADADLMFDGVNISRMFSGCTSLETLSCANWNLANCASGSGSSISSKVYLLGSELPKLKSINASGWKWRDNAFEAGVDFYNAPNLETLNCSYWRFGSSIDSVSLFNGGNPPANFITTSWNPSEIHWFS